MVELQANLYHWKRTGGLYNWYVIFAIITFLTPNSCLFLPSFVPLKLLITEACPRAWFFLWASPGLSTHSYPAFILLQPSLMHGNHLSLPHPYDFVISIVLIICYNYRLYNWTMQCGTTFFHSAQCPWNLENHCVSQHLFPFLCWVIFHRLDGWKGRGSTLTPLKFFWLVE